MGTFISYLFGQNKDDIKPEDNIVVYYPTIEEVPLQQQASEDSSGHGVYTTLYGNRNITDEPIL